jgi:hypothetical protein
MLDGALYSRRGNWRDRGDGGADELEGVALVCGGFGVHGHGGLGADALAWAQAEWRAGATGLVRAGGSSSVKVSAQARRRCREVAFSYNTCREVAGAGVRSAPGTTHGPGEAVLRRMLGLEVFRPWRVAVTGYQVLTSLEGSIDLSV